MIIDDDEKVKFLNIWNNLQSKSQEEADMVVALMPFEDKLKLYKIDIEMRINIPASKPGYILHEENDGSMYVSRIKR